MEARQYDELRRVQEVHWWFRGKKDIVTDFLDRYALEKGRLLDIGCGMGLMLEVLSNYGEVYGMDMENVAVEYSRRKVSSEMRANIKQGYLPNNVPFDNNIFDTVIGLDVLEHIEDDEAAMIRIHDILTDNGVFIATVPALMSMWSYNDVLNHHFRRYEYNELKNKITNAGFKIEKLSFYNSKLFVPAFVVRHLKNLLRIESSDVEVNGNFKGDTLLNKTLYKIFSSEKKHLRNHNYRKGVSLILVARK